MRDWQTMFWLLYLRLEGAGIHEFIKKAPKDATNCIATFDGGLSLVVKARPEGKLEIKISAPEVALKTTIGQGYGQAGLEADKLSSRGQEGQWEELIKQIVAQVPLYDLEKIFQWVVTDG